MKKEDAYSKLMACGGKDKCKGPDDGKSKEVKERGKKPRDVNDKYKVVGKEPIYKTVKVEPNIKVTSGGSGKEEETHYEGKDFSKARGNSPKDHTVNNDESLQKFKDDNTYTKQEFTGKYKNVVEKRSAYERLMSRKAKPQEKKGQGGSPRIKTL
jgi:hypothetical protein